MSFDKLGFIVACVLAVPGGIAIMNPEWHVVGLFMSGFGVLGLLVVAVHHWWGRIPTFGLGRLPFNEAARLMFEHFEARGLRDINVGDTKPLDHCKHVLITMGTAGDIVLHGQQPPSGRSRPIDPEKLRGSLPHGENSLRSLYAANRVVFENVWLSRRDARKAAKDRGDLLARLGEIQL